MREILTGVITIAAGICLAAAIMAGVVYALRPSQQITVSLGEYSCATDGEAVKCVRK